MSFWRRAKKRFKDIRFTLACIDHSILSSLHRTYYTPKPRTLSDLMYQFSKRHQHVQFIQVGANDGYFHDPIFKFIRLFNWRGVLLEPQPYVFEKYLKRLHRKRCDVFPLNAALSYEDGETQIYKIAFSNSRWATGLTSFSKAALESSIKSGHVARLARRHGEELPKKECDYIQPLTIETISPTTLMKAFRFDRLDWLQIDAEGFDFEIIKMMDIGKANPKVIVFENSHLSCHDRSASVELLKTNGYVVTDICENTIAMKYPIAGFERFFSSDFMHRPAFEDKLPVP